MTEKEVLELMKSSKSEDEWNKNCDAVKRACGGYPDFWYATIMLSGVARGVFSTWGGDDKIKIVAI